MVSRGGLFLGLIGLALSRDAHADRLFVCDQELNLLTPTGLKRIGNVQLPTDIGIRGWDIYEESSFVDFSQLDSYCVIIPLGTTEASWNDVIDPTGK